MIVSPVSPDIQDISPVSRDTQVSPGSPDSPSTYDGLGFPVLLVHMMVLVFLFFWYTC